jgi:hypothetical protein
MRLHLAARNGEYIAFLFSLARLLDDTDTPVMSIPDKAFEM